MLVSKDGRGLGLSLDLQVLNVLSAFEGGWFRPSGTPQSCSQPVPIFFQY